MPHAPTRPLPIHDALVNRSSAHQLFHCKTRHSMQLRPCHKNDGSVICLVISRSAHIVFGSSNAASDAGRYPRRRLRWMEAMHGSATNTGSRRHSEKTPRNNHERLATYWHG